MFFTKNDGAPRSTRLQHLTFTLLFCVLSTHAGLAISGSQDGTDLTVAMRNSSEHFKTTSFHTSGMARFTDLSGRYYSGQQGLEWADFGAYRLMYVTGESVPNLTQLGKRNSKLLKDATVDLEWTPGAVVMGATGVNGRDISVQVERLCNIEVKWLVGRDIKITLSTGERPIKKRDACEALVWVISAQNIKFETTQRDGKPHILLFDASTSVRGQIEPHL